MIGKCALLLNVIDPHNAEVGCNVSPHYQRNKVACEVLKCVFEV
jgi:hypothetical protein